MLYDFITGFYLVYDNEGSGEGGDGGGGGEGSGGEGGGEGGEGGSKKISMTQDELNKMMADNRRKLTKQNQELISQLQKLRDETKMSEENRAELEQRIEQLQEQYMSKEELAKREIEKQGKKHQSEVESLTGDRDKWRRRYTEATIKRSLTDAAVDGEAVRPEQIVAILGQTTYLGEVLDSSGQPTGDFRPVIKFNDINESGEPVVLELSPQDAIKRMKELPELYGNLFKGSATGGMGGGGSTATDTPGSLKEILKDPEKYRKWRKSHPDLDVSKLRK